MARCCQGDDEKSRIACCWTRMFGGWCFVRLYLVCCVVCSNKLSSPADGTIKCWPMPIPFRYVKSPANHQPSARCIEEGLLRFQVRRRCLLHHRCLVSRTIADFSRPICCWKNAGAHWRTAFSPPYWNERVPVGRDTLVACSQSHGRKWDGEDAYDF